MIRQKDGIHLQLGQTYVADSRSASGDATIVTHGHSDHSPKTDAEVICSDLTARIIEERNGISLESSERSDRVELFDAGHIIGSRAARIQDDGRGYLYTGDVATRDRAYLEGFDPVPADVLIVETTYGIPAYTFPDQDEIEQRIKDWIADTDGTVFLFGYSLGKAQKIQYLVQQATDRQIIAHGAVQSMNQVIEDGTDLEFRADPYSKHKDDLDDSIVVFPSRVSRKDWVTELADEHDAPKAGFSGWAAQDSFQYRGDYDETFILSDHCDFDDLVDLVQAVDPEKVYTQHGFDEAFASHLRSELGINARPLKKNQTSLTDF